MPEPRRERRLFWRWLALALVVVVLDQWTKHLAELWLQPSRPLTVMPVLDLVLQYNAGAAFSFLADAGGWQRWLLAAVALGVSLLLIAWLRRLGTGQGLLGCGLALLLGGALGNLWDRLSLGQVVDFIGLHWQGHYFPAFNVADSAITCGVILLLLDWWRNPGPGSGPSVEETPHEQ